MILHVRVTADLDEPLETDEATAEAGYDWLMARWREGVIVDEPFAFDQTGGYMNIRVPAEDKPTALRQLDEILADYPLRGTITNLVDKRVPLREGFDTFVAAIREHRRIAVST